MLGPSLKIRSFKTRIFALVWLTLLPPLILVGWIEYRYTYDAIRTEKMSAVSRVADARYGELTGYLRRTSRRVDALLNNIELNCGAARPEVKDGCVREALRSAIGIERAQGAMLWDESTDPPIVVGGFKFDAIPHQEMKSGQIARFVRGPSPSGGVFLIEAAHSANAMRLILTVSLDLVQDIFVNDPALGESGETFLADDQGFFITRPRYESTQGNSHPISARPMRTCLSHRNSEVLDPDYRDVPIIHGFRFVPEIGGGCIMAHVDQAEAFAVLEKLKWRFVSFGLGAALLSGLMAVYLGRRVVAPVSDLGKAAQAIAGGDYTARAESSGDDELAGLAHAFNHMAERLQQTVGELKARSSELRKLSLAVEQSSHMIFITDPAGQIEYVNQRFVELTGYSRSEAMGRNPRLFKSNDTGQDVYHAMWATILGGRTWRGEIRDRRKDGTHFWAMASITPVKDASGTIVHFVAMHEDITARKDAEAQTRIAREQAEVANRAKSELLANMSHELRTPLNAIIGFSEALLSGIFGALTQPKHADYLHNIHTSGNHLLALVNDILDVSAIEAGKLTLSEESVDTDAVIEASMRLIAPRAEQGKVTLAVEPAEHPIRLRADGRRLKQIALNLLSNAVKFTPEGGQVTIASTVNGTGGYTLTVTDTGIGMTDAEKARALDRFGQVDSGLNRRYEGAGLGLPLTIGLIEAHGGYFHLHSEKGKGTVARAVFPRERLMP